MLTADKYLGELTRACPAGSRSLRAHELKHTFGHGLRAAGVGSEERKTLLARKSDHITTQYSAPEYSSLIKAAERVCELGTRKSPALALVRAQTEAVSA